MYLLGIEQTQWHIDYLFSIKEQVLNWTRRGSFVLALKKKAKTQILR